MKPFVVAMLSAGLTACARDPVSPVDGPLESAGVHAAATAERAVDVTSAAALDVSAETQDIELRLLGSSDNGPQRLAIVVQLRRLEQRALAGDAPGVADAIRDVQSRALALEMSAVDRDALRLTLNAMLASFGAVQLLHADSVGTLESAHPHSSDRRLP